jgi:hypothetical protein
MNCSDTILLIVFIFVVAVVIGKYVKPHIFDEYEPQNMGSHKYWGFGRDYGYSIDDTLQRDNFCYQVTFDNYYCQPGYHRRTNPNTLRQECCVNRFNFGR